MAKRLQTADLEEAVKRVLGNNYNELVETKGARKDGKFKLEEQHLHPLWISRVEDEKQPSRKVHLGIDLVYRSPDFAEVTFLGHSNDSHYRIRNHITILETFEKWRASFGKRGYKTSLGSFGTPPDKPCCGNLKISEEQNNARYKERSTYHYQYSMELKSDFSSQSALNRLVKDVKEVLEGGK